MTERVKEYLAARKEWQYNHDDTKETEYKARLIKLRKELSLNELYILKDYISPRAFWEGIAPLIEQKTGKPYPRPQNDSATA